MRVALFFDGKNHMKDLRRATQDRWIDHNALSEFVVRKIGGTRFVGAWYYTGVPLQQAGTDEHTHERHALSDLLEELEKKPGFFVRRFNRRVATRECSHCKQIISYTEEKMVDTSLVVDLVMLASRDAFDAAVVFSGDLDVAPALTALRALGKQAWIATFGDQGLSKSLVREAWAHIDLLSNLESFAHPQLVDPRLQNGPISGKFTPPPALDRAAPERETTQSSGLTAGGAGMVVPPLSDAGSTPAGVDRAPTVYTSPSGGHRIPFDVDRELLRELRRAEIHFAAGGGFVGAHYFIHRWKGHAIPDSPDSRRQAVQRLLQSGRAETYVVDGKTALRVAPGVLDDESLEISSNGLDDEEQTVEMRLSETLVRRLRAKLDES